MLKKIVFFVMLCFLCISLANCAEVRVNAEISKESTIFEYKILFGINESYSTFSFEKPRDAKIISVLEGNTSVRYSSAGDYFIFRPENTNGKNFTIIFISVLKSQEIIESNIFSTYLNFNFPVEKLIYVTSMKEDFGYIIDTFPRNYEVLKSKDIMWTVNNLQNDTLFLIKFGKKVPNQNIFLSFFNSYWHLFLFILVLGIFIFSALIFKRKGYIDKLNIDKIKLKKFITKDKITVKQNVVDEEKFEELTAKYLTDNEKEVVDIVKNNPGISQYDILNHLPSITKSNLSKIISKLHVKKILNRIRVGKVNKIYLGDRIEKNNTGNNEEEENKHV